MIRRTPDPALPPFLSDDMEQSRHPPRGKPIIITEYGADSYPGHHSIVAEPWSGPLGPGLLASGQHGRGANPWTARAATSRAGVDDIAQAAEPTVKMPIPRRNTRLRP